MPRVEARRRAELGTDSTLLSSRRFPGLTDHAANAWFSMIATGLEDAVQGTGDYDKLVGCYEKTTPGCSHSGR